MRKAKELKIAEQATPLELSFGDVELILRARFSIDIDRMPAFRGRLQNLQRKGFPAGVNTGKGKPALYGFSQISELTLAFTFIDLGMQPDQAVELVQSRGTEIIEEIKGYVYFLDIERDLQACLEVSKKGDMPKLRESPDSAVIVVYPNALGPLKTEDSQKPEMYILNVRDFREDFGGHTPFSSYPAIVIPTGEIIMRILFYVAIIKKWSAKETAASYLRWATDYGIENGDDTKA